MEPQADTPAGRGPAVVNGRRFFGRHAGAARLPAPGLTLRQADALATGLPAGSAAVVTCAFGLKTLAPGTYPALAAEVARLLRPGGQLALLEFDLPTQPWLRAAMLGYLRLLPATLRHACPEAAAHAALARYASAGTQWPALRVALERVGFWRVRQQRLWPGWSCGRRRRSSPQKRRAGRRFGQLSQDA